MNGCLRVLNVFIDVVCIKSNLNYISEHIRIHAYINRPSDIGVGQLTPRIVIMTDRQVQD